MRSRAAHSLDKYQFYDRRRPPQEPLRPFTAFFLRHVWIRLFFCYPDMTEPMKLCALALLAAFTLAAPVFASPAAYQGCFEDRALGDIGTCINCTERDSNGVCVETPLRVLARLSYNSGRS
jgi:hypothetical protein